MNKFRKYLARTVAVGAIVGLSACAGMTTQERNTAIGAAVGGVAGSALTGGSTIGTLGGAAAGGLIGNQVNRR